MASGDENNSISVSEYLRELKSNISTWEDIVIKSQKLNANLKNVSQSACNVMDSIGLLCVAGRNNVAGIDRVTQLLSEITVMERYVSEKTGVLNKAVHDNLVVNLSQQIETWRRSVTTIKKDREIDGRKAKSEYKNSLSEVTKLEKRINKRSGRKQSLSDTMSLQADYANKDLQNKERFVEELERCVLRKAICEERSRYRFLVECLRPVLDAQLSMRADFDELQRIYNELYTAPLCDLSAVPTEVETYVRQYQVSEQSRANSFCSEYSRANSQLSLGSSSRSSSIDEDHGSLHPYLDNLDTSSSTLHNESSQHCSMQRIDKMHAEEEVIRPQASDADTTISAESTLYPNQALPPPRYCNLRQLKQNAEKKFGMSTLSRDLPLPAALLPQYSDRSLSRDTVQSQYNECTFSRDHTTNAPISLSLLPSHYSDCTLTRHCNQSKDSASLGNKDSDIYATISHLYGTASLSGDVTSGTSTFKRRKPSNVTAMDAPVITDKRFYQTQLSDNPRLRKHNSDDCDQRNNRTGTNDRREYSDLRHSVDLSNIVGYSLENSRRQNNVSIGALDTAVTRSQPPSSSRKSSLCRDYHLSRYGDGISDSSSPPAAGNSYNGDSSIFKQQLLHVIQTGRTPSSCLYQKPFSSSSSHMF